MEAFQKWGNTSKRVDDKSGMIQQKRIQKSSYLNKNAFCVFSADFFPSKIFIIIYTALFQFCISSLFSFINNISFQQLLPNSIWIHVFAENPRAAVSFSWTVIFYWQTLFIFQNMKLLKYYNYRRNYEFFIILSMIYYVIGEQSKQLTAYFSY